MLSIGTIADNVSESINQLKNNESVAHYDLRFVKPLDEQLLDAIFKKFDTIITVEDGAIKGGFGSEVLEYASEANYQGKIKLLGIPDEFIHHGTIQQLQEVCGIDTTSIRKTIQDLL